MKLKCVYQNVSSDNVRVIADRLHKKHLRTETSGLLHEVLIFRTVDSGHDQYLVRIFFHKIQDEITSLPGCVRSIEYLDKKTKQNRTHNYNAMAKNYL